MIQANELRIGNWFRIPSEDLDGNKLLISHVWDFQGFNTDFSLRSFLESCEPIPLTPEILEKAGFLWNESLNHWTITWGKNGVHFIKFDEHYQKFSFQLGQAHYKVLDYLHQLQNLYYCLTGEELNIEL